MKKSNYITGNETVERSYSVQTTSPSHAVKKSSKICSGAVLRMIAATFCIAGAVATWIAMAEALQNLNKSYHNSYFMIWFVHSSYASLYIAWAAWRYFPYIPVRREFSCNSIGNGSLPHSKKLIFWSGVLAVISLVSGYTWYLSLPQTNIPANTAIYQCSSAFVFVISVPLLKERVTLLKICCVLLSISGVFMVAFFSNNNTHCTISATNLTNSTLNESYMGSQDDYGDDSGCDAPTEVNTPFGYIMLVISVITYALFETLFKKFAAEKNDKAASINSLRVLGYIGVTSLFLLWPPLIILHFTGYEVFHLPPTLELLGLLVLNGFMSLVFNGCLLVAIALSSPLYASVGTIVAIPTSVVVDWIVQHFIPSPLSFAGIGLILSGFTGFVISEAIEIRRESKHKKQSKLRKVTVSSGASSDESKPLIDNTPVEPKPTLRSRIVKFLY